MAGNIADRIENLKRCAKKGSPGGKDKKGSGRKKNVVDLSMLPRINDFMKSMGGRNTKRNLVDEEPEVNKRMRK